MTPSGEVEAGPDKPEQGKAPAVGAEQLTNQPNVEKASLGEEQPPKMKNDETTANPTSEPGTASPSEPPSKKKPRYCAFPSDEGCIVRGSNVPLQVDM